MLEALRAGRRKVFEVWLPAADETSNLARREIRTLAESGGARIHTVERSSEIRAVADPYPEESFEQLLATSSSPRLVVALDGVTDVGNLGSIARSAETAGAMALVLELRHSPPIGAGALRASSGALEHLRVARTPNLAKALELARQEGIRTLAADPTGGPLSEIPRHELDDDLVWVFGSEERGIRPSVLAGADRKIGIPVLGRVGSLGVAAAAAVLLHGTAALRNPSCER